MSGYSYLSPYGALTTKRGGGGDGDVVATLEQGDRKSEVDLFDIPNSQLEKCHGSDAIAISRRRQNCCLDPKNEMTLQIVVH